MESKIYISNTCLLNRQIQACATFKITINENNFMVKKYDTGDEVITIQKNASFVCDWISYSPVIGLFLDNICVGINLFNLDNETYDRIQKTSLPTLFNVLQQNNLDQIEQCTSDKRIKNINGLHLYGKCEMHYISNTNGLTFTCGAFSNLIKYCSNTKYTGLATVNVDATFEEGSKCIVSGTDDNIKITYTYSSST